MTTPKIPEGYSNYLVTYNQHGLRLGLCKDVRVLLLAKSSTQARREAAQCGMNIKMTTAKKIA
jgi:hypothetical protein